MRYRGFLFTVDFDEQTTYITLVSNRYYPYRCIFFDHKFDFEELQGYLDTLVERAIAYDLVREKHIQTAY